MSHGRKKSTTAPLTPHWVAMMVQSSVSCLVYIFSLYWKAPWKRIKWVYTETMDLILCNTNSQQTDKMRKKIISIFKSIDFKIELTTNLTEVDFLDVTFNLERNTYGPYKKPNDNLTYINISSNHPPQIIKYLTQTRSETLSRNSSSAEIFEQSKPDYEEALKNCGYKAKLQYIQPNLQQNNTRRKTRKIVWFNPPFGLNVKTNVAKCFLQLIDTHFPPANKLHKIFNRNR